MMAVRRQIDNGVRLAEQIGRVCAVSGCGSTLGATNTSGVCRFHNHYPGVCGCTACAGKRAEPVETERKRIVSVPYATGNSGIGGYAKVSLPREPWN